jgi:hypothetical protein
MHKHRIALFVIAILFILLCFFSSWCSKKVGHSDYIEFNSSVLKGRITYLYSSSGGERIKLNNSGKKFTFFSVMSKVNNYSTFAEDAEIGDSVYKGAYSDTLYLFKSGSNRAKAYTFQKL